MQITDATLERWLREDLPHLDLTTETLGIGSRPGRIRFKTRQETILCGTEEAARVLELCGAQVESCEPSGSNLTANQEFLTAKGSASALHSAWKLALNILEHASGVATRTHEFRLKAQAVAPHIEILTTRKHLPGNREMLVKAIMAGGALPHRLGLSETFLAFEQHRIFFATPQAFFSRITELKRRLPEKKILVECLSLEEARAGLEAGADGIQFDKLKPTALQDTVLSLRAEFPKCLLLAAGGITLDNVAAYAATGVDGLVSSSIYHAPPSNIGVSMETGT